MSPSPFGARVSAPVTASPDAVTGPVALVAGAAEAATSLPPLPVEAPSSETAATPATPYTCADCTDGMHFTDVDRCACCGIPLAT